MYRLSVVFCLSSGAFPLHMEGKLVQTFREGSGGKNQLLQKGVGIKGLLLYVYRYIFIYVHIHKHTHTCLVGGTGNYFWPS